MVKDEQVRLLRRLMAQGKTQQTAAATAGMSVRSARTWAHGPMPSEKRKTRDWRTRPDPFKGDHALIERLLQADKQRKLQAKTVLEVLMRERPGRYRDSHLRSLQRHIKRWRALHGPDKEVMFEQEAVPGRSAHVDFTHATELEVTIAGAPLVHLLFHLRLAFSRWSYVELAFGETYEALVQGIQNAFWEMGGVTEELVLDSLSAASHRLGKSVKRVTTQRFRDFLDHMDSGDRRINVRKSNENGVVEKGHDLLKKALYQALMLRGSHDFATLQDYAAFIASVVERFNAERLERLEVERTALKPLPATRFAVWTTFKPVVRRWSTITVAGRRYSVPSRLIGETVEARQHADFIEVRYAGEIVEVFPRLRGSKFARIDYRHIAWSLANKPGAFAHYRFREELFPTMAFRRAYDVLRKWRDERADVEYVRILHLAASTMESTVDGILVGLLESGERFDYATVQELAGTKRSAVPEIDIGSPDLTRLDKLIGGAR